MDNLKTLLLISIFLIIVLLQKKYCFHKTRNIFLLISLVPLFLIGVLFPAEYMWDIIVYERNVSNIRNYNFDISPKTFRSLYLVICLIYFTLTISWIVLFELALHQN